MVLWGGRGVVLSLSTGWSAVFLAGTGFFPVLTVIYDTTGFVGQVLLDGPLDLFGDWWWGW